jgi:hypothetical protein
MAGVNKAGLRVVWIRVFAVLASLALGTAAFAQAGSTGGTLGKTDKSVTGTSDDIAEPNRKKGSRGVPDSSPRRIESRIAVTSATYGGNCGAPRGNVTQHLAQACNGKSDCDYVIDWQVIGDPKRFCGKTYVAEWRCGDGAVRSASVPPEAGYQKSISLRCN